MREKWRAENRQVVNLIQAMLGSVSENLRAVSLAISGEKVVVHFLLQTESASDREEIGDVLFEFEALQESGVEVEGVVQVDAGRVEDIHLPGRLIFLRKEFGTT